MRKTKTTSRAIVALEAVLLLLGIVLVITVNLFPTAETIATSNSTDARSDATIVSTDNDDVIEGTEGSDVILGLSGNDKIFA